MSAKALVFMLGAWIFVLGLTFWCFWKLMHVPAEHEKMPPPGTSL
jgi:hypothetical protein